MKIIPMFEDFLTEKTEDSYEAGCAMLYFDFPKISDIHSKINEDDLYTEEEDRSYGLEDEPHCTLLYGLDPNVTLNQVTQKINDNIFSPLLATNASLFENDKYDVLKFDMRYPTKGEAFLHKCNKSLCELPYKTDYPDYHPHMTIAYLKPGMGKKYVDMLKNEEYELEPQHAVYSEANGTKTKIKINK
jgi:2'-5' RNA ligase